MARRSILSAAREAQPSSPIEELSIAPSHTAPRSSTKPSRRAKLHLGGYYEPRDPIVIAFQKLGIDLRRSQQDMLLEALQDFVAKHEALNAFQ